MTTCVVLASALGSALASAWKEAVQDDRYSEDDDQADEAYNGGGNERICTPDNDTDRDHNNYDNGSYSSHRCTLPEKMIL